jgi:hypothetical protein
MDSYAVRGVLWFPPESTTSIATSVSCANVTVVSASFLGRWTSALFTQGPIMPVSKYLMVCGGMTAAAAAQGVL